MTASAEQIGDSSQEPAAADAVQAGGLNSADPHFHCVNGCEKAHGQMTCVQCGAPFVQCTPDICEDHGADDAHAAARRFQRERAAPWQSIETAPKDGTHILICNVGEPLDAARAVPSQTVAHWWPVEGEEGFYHSSTRLENSDEPPFTATHWKPLDGPPALAEANSQDGLRVPSAQTSGQANDLNDQKAGA